METAIAKLNHARIPPRKARIVADLIRGLSVQEAEAQLMLSTRRHAGAILKLLKSAIANAVFKKIDANKLFIKEIRVDQGPKSKRWMPRARGSASIIEKKTSHITIILGVLDSPKKVPFIIPEKPKKKKDKKIKKEKQTKKKQEDHNEPEYDKKQQKKPGVFNKVFRRKAI